MTAARGVRMTTDLRDPDAVPYFLWDDPMTLSELRGRLREAPEPQRSSCSPVSSAKRGTRKPGSSLHRRKWFDSGPG